MSFEYGLNWIGKTLAKNQIDTPHSICLVEDKAHNKKPENKISSNIFIEGESLEVLKYLKDTYANSVKMIYIDPPYNTGKKFCYNDKFTYTPQQIADMYNISLIEAKKSIKSVSKRELSHSAWLTFMYPRLYIARELLKDDGVIFISIDNNEMAQLRILCDEIFGEENFIEIFSWVKTSTPPSLSTKSRKTNEYILCYEKNKDNQKYVGENQDDGDEPLLNSGNSKVKLIFPANTFSIKFMERGILKAGEYEKVTLLNDISINNYFATNDVELVGEFKWTQNKLDEEVSNGTTFIAKTEKISVRFQRLEKGSKRPTNFIKDKIITPVINKSEQQVETNEIATKEVMELFGTEVFSYTKPISLIQYLTKFKTTSNDIVLDFFAGSGTTAHAVMQLNAEDGGNRQFILVQLPEKTNEKSEAFKAGFKNIAEISKERIRLAGAAIRKSHPNKKIDTGFKSFKATRT
ncbi:hypothetical protein BKK52_11210 [Rodentibacter trehalosifermentans]|uniref:site-specific DNA-methyltransferase (adenine-specific) n=1 Tax=Rodentibacter trehalosifermentans TaxID=1908263 RepID=A0A1V3IWA9_9PAST|nr:site-specific DNA-methyltransferase [Rodentibacter trehalosifermentans]OOF46576.1 hypothetical protein BKK52_11210 [Rodentibacter trehalosifermentans]